MKRKVLKEKKLDAENEMGKGDSALNSVESNEITSIIESIYSLLEELKKNKDSLRQKGIL